MKLRDLFKENRVTLSFEVFPPKTSASYESVEKAAMEIARLKPDYMSVTYGAGGGTSQYSVEIASSILKDYQVPVLSHLTCVSSTKDTVRRMLTKLSQHGLENILALRGDIPAGMDLPKDYHHAADLIADIRACGEDFCIGGACYPEGHTEAATKQEDILHIKEKVDAGCEFLTTQMFFDNNIFYNYLYQLREKGIFVPIIAGIMPVTNGKQIKRIIGLSGTQLPPRFRAIADKFGDTPPAMKQAGIAYATDQIIDLIANGVKHIHVYSMNRPDVAKGIQDNLSEIIG